MIKMMWRCEECGQVHENETFANACCADVTMGYQCEYCGEFYEGVNGDEDAKNCTHDEDEEDEDAE